MSAPRAEELEQDQELLRRAEGDSELCRQLAQRLRAVQYENIFLRAQSDSAIDGIMVVSSEGKWLWFNRRFVELWQLPAHIVASRSDEQGLALVLDRIVDPQAFITKVQHLYEHPREESRDLVALKDGRFFDRHSAPVTGLDGQYLGRVWFFRDITDLKRTEIQLSLARDEALAATRAKSTFLANMSHELRTPLNAVLGYSELLREEAEEFGRQEIIPDVQRIHSAGTLLLTLINDLLDLSKIEAGKVDLTWNSFSVEELVAEVTDVVRPMLGPGVDLRLPTMAPAGPLFADRSKLRQVLLNVLANACKFTDRGEVVLSVTTARRDPEEGESIAFRVEDTGVGMTVEELRQIFHPFAQGKAAATRKQPGTGLGLAISRRLCQLMNGDITVSSQPGQGSVFTIWIPTRPPPGRALAPAGDAPPDRLAAAPGARTVLVVDDDEPTLALLKRCLEKQGHVVCTAADGEEALRLARTVPIDLITLDVMMPRLDGWTLLPLLQKEPALAHIPVLLVTILDHREQALAKGAVDLLTKPVDRERLAALVGRHASPRPAGATVLVVDDDSELRLLLRRVLEKRGWQVSEAENGQVALEQISQQRPDLILLDLMMPTMDGFAFLEELRRRDLGRVAPVVVLTAKELNADDHRRLGHSVARVLQKGNVGGGAINQVVDQLLPTLLESRRASNRDVEL